MIFNELFYTQTEIGVLKNKIMRTKKFKNKSKERDFQAVYLYSGQKKLPLFTQNKGSREVKPNKTTKIQITQKNTLLGFQLNWV